ncbi:hypothetical protein [Aurantiacibacter zhengii]|nr:hypothetical protein [Aurantiacibacter zhengii]
MRLKTALLGLLLGSAVLALPACNAVRGLGQDLKSVADAGEEAID